MGILILANFSTHRQVEEKIHIQIRTQLGLYALRGPQINVGRPFITTIFALSILLQDFSTKVVKLRLNI